MQVAQLFVFCFESRLRRYIGIYLVGWQTFLITLSSYVFITQIKSHLKFKVKEQQMAGLSSSKLEGMFQSSFGTIELVLFA